MKMTFIIILILIVAIIVIRSTSRTGEAPGLVKGLLLRCPDKPNCVCSEFPQDTNHYIDPITIPQNVTFDFLPILKNVILEMGGSVLVERNNYIAATFTSTLFKFVDDLEIRVDMSHHVIHVRSASRVGYSDMGVNKKRMELLKKLFNHKLSMHKNYLSGV